MAWTLFADLWSKSFENKCCCRILGVSRHELQKTTSELRCQMTYLIVIRQVSQTVMVRPCLPTHLMHEQQYSKWWKVDVAEQDRPIHGEITSRNGQAISHLHLRSILLEQPATLGRTWSLGVSNDCIMTLPLSYSELLNDFPCADLGLHYGILAGGNSHRNSRRRKTRTQSSHLVRDELFSTFGNFYFQWFWQIECHKWWWQTISSLVIIQILFGYQPIISKSWLVLNVLLIYSKAFDSDMSPLSFGPEKMYHFISERFDGTSTTVQEQCLEWLQV